MFFIKSMSVPDPQNTGSSFAGPIPMVDWRDSSAAVNLSSRQNFLRFSSVRRRIYPTRLPAVARMPCDESVA
jgi:hypothetical protein